MEMLQEGCKDNMKFDVRYSNHPRDVKHYTTSQLREDFLIETVFESDEINLVYSHNDRIIAGGVMPVNKELKLESTKELASEYFLELREMGAINIAGPGVITIDGVDYAMNFQDGLYKSSYQQISMAPTGRAWWCVHQPGFSRRGTFRSTGSSA